jgi:hypothetical protein
MGDEGTKLSAVDAAKKAEEAIRNAEMLEKIARDATQAAAQAREEAEQAKEQAKLATKKKKEEIVESVKKVSEAVQKNKAVDRKFVLDYLQKHAWDLHRTLDNVFDIRFEDEPPRVVMVVVPGPDGPDAIELPKLMHNGTEVPVELELKKPAAVMVGENVMEETENAIITQDEDPKDKDEVYHRSITGQAAKTLGVKEALGPHSMDQAAKKREAYEAWLKRHPSVKIK